MRTKVWCGLIFAIVLLLSFNLSAFATATPVVNSIVPNKGLDSQVVNVTIEGTKFHQKTVKVKLARDGQPDIVATNIVFVSKEKLLCSFDLKGKALGNWDLVVSNTGTITKKEKIASLKEAFTIDPTLPVITSVEPKQAFNNDILTLKLKGDYFQQGAQVSLVFNNIVLAPMNTVVVSANEIQAKFSLNGTTPGDYDVQVVNPDGRKGALSKAVAIKQAPLALYSIEPNSATNAGSVTVTLFGFSFEKNMTVRLKQNNTIITAANTELISVSQAKATFNLAGANTGLYDVEISNSKGESAKLSGAFGIVKDSGVQVISPSPNTQPDGANGLNSQLSSIFFDFDKYNVRSDQEKPLADNLAVLEKRPANSFIVLGGHADERGPNNYNITLSAKRAETIKKFLISKGINAAKIIIYAYGEEYPAKEGKNEESWAYNRRVDIAIWETLPTKKEALKK